MTGRTEATDEVHPCPRCGGRRWRHSRGPDCMYAVCPCGFGYDIGWGPNPRYFPDEAKSVPVAAALHDATGDET